MEKNRIVGFLAGVLFVFGSAASGSAAFIDRGGGLIIYDTDLNITWLQDANLAATNTFGVSGINPAGRMTLYTASSYNYNFSYDGSTDRGYNLNPAGKKKKLVFR